MTVIIINKYNSNHQQNDTPYSRCGISPHSGKNILNIYSRKEQAFTPLHNETVPQLCGETPHLLRIQSGLLYWFPPLHFTLFYILNIFSFPAKTILNPYSSPFQNHNTSISHFRNLQFYKPQYFDFSSPVLSLENITLTHPYVTTFHFAKIRNFLQHHNSS